MRTLKKLSNRAIVIRTQERMDQNYIINVARNILGELKMAIGNVESYPSAKEFSKDLFPEVHNHIKDWNSETLGRIAAYGLGRDQTAQSTPARVTTLEQVSLEPEDLCIQLSGGAQLEGLAALTIVATIFDILLAHVVARQLTEWAEAEHGHKYRR